MDKSRVYVPCRCRSSVVLFQRRGYSGGRAPVGERDAVKTSFSFAIPSPVSRATSDDVQGNNNFLGIESLRLMPFSGLNGDYVGGNSVLRPVLPS